MKNETENNIATVKSILQFHGLQLTIIEHNGVEYVPIRPIIELIGLNWNSAKTALSKGFKQKKFQFTTLTVAKLAGWGVITPPHSTVFCSKKYISI